MIASNCSLGRTWW
jgi:hypothetical protein